MESNSTPPKPKVLPLRDKRDIPYVVFSPLLFPLIFLLWAIIT